MEDYDKNKELSSHVLGCQHLVRIGDGRKVACSHTSLLSIEEFMQDYNEDSGIGYILEIVKYPKELQDLHSNMPFLPKRMKIEKCKNLVCNLYDKKFMPYT